MSRWTKWEPVIWAVAMGLATWACTLVFDRWFTRGGR